MNTKNDPWFLVPNHDPPEEYIVKKTIERGRLHGTRTDERMEFRGDVIRTWKHFCVCSRVSSYYTERFSGDLEKELDRNAIRQVLTDFPYLKHLTIVGIKTTKNFRPETMNEEHIYRFIFCTAEIQLLSDKKPHIFI